MVLSSRFEEALVFATRLHAGWRRKEAAIPYIAHLLGVTSIVLENGGNKDEAIAALLHDAVEDQGGASTREEIRRRFGDDECLPRLLLSRPRSVRLNQDSPRSCT